MRLVNSLFLILLATGCARSSVLVCDPTFHEEGLHCVKGKKSFDVLNPDGYHCAKIDDMDLYMTQCLQGLPVPQIDVCVYNGPDEILCPDKVISPPSAALGYECTSQAQYDRMILRCNRQ